MSYWPFLHDSMLVYLMIHVSFDTNVLRIDANNWHFGTKYDVVLNHFPMLCSVPETVRKSSQTAETGQ